MSFLILVKFLFSYVYFQHNEITLFTLVGYNIKEYSYAIKTQLKMINLHIV